MQIAAIAKGQHGVITREQLRRILADGSIARRVRKGRLHRLYRAVFSVGHEVLTKEGRFLAAVLTCGPGAVLSHYSAGVLWGLLKADMGTVDVTTAARGRKGSAGIRLHRARTLDRCEVTEIKGIPVTTVARTLLDLAGDLSPSALARMLHEAEIRKIFDQDEMTGALGRANGRAGVAAVRSVVQGDTSPTRSKLELRFLALCRKAGFPRPRVNREVLGHEVDFHWPAQRMIVETDGWETHKTRFAFEQDRARDAARMAAGYRVVRFTWRQVLDSPDLVAVTLARVLGVLPR